MKTHFFLLCLLLATISATAQQDAQFTQYMYNTTVINPAYAGSRDVLSIFGMYRTQWVGLDGAPETSSLSFNSPINNSSLGIGATLVNDKIGPTDENDFSIDLSYTVRTSENYKLSFGIKASGSLFNLDVNKLSLQSQADQQFQNLNNVFRPNIGAGVYYHSDRGYVGFSVPHFIETKRYDDNDVAIYKDKMHYYFMGGCAFDLSSVIIFKPAFLVKMTGGAPLQVDTSANFMFYDKFVAGISYRWSGAISSMVGFQITDGLYLGYGYDRETTHLNNYNSGSHEIFLRYEFLKNNIGGGSRFF